jgi:hypothetical protein
MANPSSELTDFMAFQDLLTEEEQPRHETAEAGGRPLAAHRKSVSFFLDAPSFGSRFAWQATQRVA